MDLAQYRKQHPEFKNVSDRALATYIYKKFNSDMPEDVFFSKIGIEPQPKAHSIGEALDIRAKTAFQDIYQGGIPQLFGGNPERLEQEYQQRENLNDIAQTLSPTGGTIGNILGNVGALAPAAAIAPPNVKGSIGARLAKLVGIGGAEGAATSMLNYVPEKKSRIDVGISGGLLGAALGPFADVGGMITSVLTGGRKTAAQKADILANQEAAKGTNTALGRVVGSPVLNSIKENVVDNAFLSGGANRSAQTAQQVIERANNLHQKLVGDVTVDNPNEALLGNLREDFLGANAIKNKLYSEANIAGDVEGVIPLTGNYDKVAKDYLDKINKNSRLMQLTDKPLIKDLQEIVGNKNISSLEELGMLRAPLRDKEKAYSMSLQAFPAGVYNKLGKAASKDIKDSFKLSSQLGAHGKAQEKFEAAEKFYKESYSPFKQKEVAKYITNFDKESDGFIQKFSRSTRGNDKPDAINKLMGAINVSSNPEGNMQLMRQGILGADIKNKNGYANPTAMANTLMNMGENQRKAFLGGDEELAKEAFNLSRLESMNKDALNLMFNPKTGNRWVAPGMIAGGATAGASMGPLGAIAGGLLGTGLGVGQALNSALTSEGIRDALIKKMFEDTLKRKTSRVVPGVAASVNTQRENREERRKNNS